ncbi:MAG: hypothetical protein IKC36_00520 [Clostridia bacterium]|nr:hypothetical protein [Clostridia bacterium]
MKKKLLILLSVLTLVCCALFGVSVVGSAQTQTIVKTSGSLEIKSSYTAAQQLMYYKTPVKGAVTLEFDYKPNAWNAKWGFGLTTDNRNSNPYSSRMIYCENDIGKGGSYWTPWASSFVGSQKPWQNYNEDYAGEYKIFQKVRIKMEVSQMAILRFLQNPWRAPEPMRAIILSRLNTFR